MADDEKWAKAERALKESLDALEVDYYTAAGEAAFYGPKADFMARDVLGREWQLSTIQIDFIQPERLGCEYIGEDGEPHTPVVIHRAVTGATERFLGVMIEHFGGAFPTWLSPVQAIVLPVADRHLDYAGQVVDAPEESRPAGRGRLTQRAPQRQDTRCPGAEDPVHAGSRQQGGRGGHRVGPPAHRRRSGRSSAL